MGATGRHILTNGAGVTEATTSLRFGRRGPLLVEDRVLNETILAFAHSARMPRVVHAGGVVARGWFECSDPLDAVCAVHAFGAIGRRTPVVARFSAMSGREGAPDAGRDVRGMAVRLRTAEGDLDLLCQSIPVSFVQDALLYPALVAARRSSVPDPFWRLVGTHPETVHALLHLMSSRGVPAGYQTMDAHAVHTYRLVASSGRWQYAKFHWLAAEGTDAFDDDEAQLVCAVDPAHHAHRLIEAVRSGRPPTWELAVQVFDEDTAATQPYDVLDPTKLLPEEDVPMRPIGRLVLDEVVPEGHEGDEGTDGPDEPDLALSAAHLVPGVDVSEDPVLQARIAAYLPAHLARVGPAVLRASRGAAGGGAMVMPQIIGVADHVERVRRRPSLFADHHGQARQFWHAQSAHEQAHVIDAIWRDLRDCDAAVIQGVLVQLAEVATPLARAVGQRLGATADSVPVGRSDTIEMPPRPSLSVGARRQDATAIRPQPTADRPVTLG